MCTSKAHLKVNIFLQAKRVYSAVGVCVNETRLDVYVCVLEKVQIYVGLFVCVYVLLYFYSSRYLYIYVYIVTVYIKQI